MNNINENSIEAKLAKAGSAAKSIGIKGLALAAVLVTAMSSYTTVDSGETVRIQNTISGAYEWHMKEGMKFKVPYFSKVDVYNSVSTVAVTDDRQLIETSSTTRMPLAVTFADNYGGALEASWRLRLSTSPEELEMMHQEVKSQANLEGNTFLTFAKDMLNLTTDQFLAQDFMQGGKGAFKQRLQDQGDNGMLQTKREKVEIVAQVADQGLTGQRKQNETAKQFAYKVVIQLDKDGNPLRRPHSLSKYGIEVSQVDLGEFAPAGDLTAYVNTIKTREKERADLIADQRKEREQAVSAQLRGETNRITAKNKALMAKDKEVIEGNKRVELAQIQAKREVVEREKVATLAKIDKQRELDIAKANEGIQRANSVAAKHQAQAIKYKGFAEAEVAKAKLAAKQANKTIYLAELNRDVAIQQARSMEKTTLDAPDMVIMGSGQGGTTSDLLNVKLVQDVTAKSSK